MPGGTLIVSRAIKLFPYYKKCLEDFGFKDVEATGEEKDGLNTVIKEMNPRLVLMGSGFYQACTPLMAGRLLKMFPRLNIAAVSVYEFPDSIAVWFIFYGVKSYLNLWEGYEEFSRGLRIVRDGGEYISAGVKEAVDLFSEWPKTGNRATERLMEVLVLLCNGFSAESIGRELRLTRKAVYNCMSRLYAAFNVKCRDEMVARAWELHVVSEKDIRFFDRRKEAPLPEWAVVKQKIDRNTAKPAPVRILRPAGGGGFNAYTD